MTARIKERLTPKTTVVLDPVTGQFTQMGHIVHGPKILKREAAVCDYCNKTYSKRRKDQRFCHDRCRMSWWVRENHGGVEPDYGEVACIVCNITFKKTRPWSKCCSDICREAHRRELVASYRQKPLQESV